MSFLGKTTYGFEAQEFRNPMLQTYHNLGLKRWRYDQSKQCCTKSMLLLDCIWVQFLLVVWAEFQIFPFGLMLVAIGFFGFSILTNPIFRCRAIFGNLGFIQILITKYAIGSIKAIGKVSIYLFPYFYYMLLINCICGLKISWYS